MTTERLLQETGWLNRLARGLCGDPDRAADVAQETMARALARPPRVGPEGPRPWLATVARNVARRLSRRDAQRPAAERAAARTEATASAAELVARAEVHRAAVDAVLALDEPYREALLLRFLEDLPPRAVAERLGVPVETARTWIKRGLERVRRELDRRNGGRRAWLLALGMRPPVTSSTLLGIALMGLKGKTIAATLGLACAGLLAFAFASNVGEVPEPLETASSDGATAARQAPANARPEAVRASGAPAAVRAPVDAPPAIAGRTLRGVVLAEESLSPLPDVTVVVRAATGNISDETREVARGSTGADGAFELAFEETDDLLEVELRAAGRALVREEVRRRGEAPEVASRREDLGEITVPPGTTVTGRVVAADGVSAASGAELVVAPEWVWMSRGDRSVILRDAFRAGTADPGGRFELARPVVANEWQGPLLIAVHPDGIGWTQLDELRRSAQRLTDVEIELEPAFELELVARTATGAPAVDLGVRVEPNGTPLGIATNWPRAQGPLAARFAGRTNAAGVLRMRGLPASLESYRVFVGTGDPRMIRVEVDAAAAGAVRRLEVQLPESDHVVVEGVVTEGGGAPLGGVAVGTREASVETDAHGRYELAVPRGMRPVRVTAGRVGYAEAVLFVDVAGTWDRTSWDPTLVTAGTIEGTVVDENADPVAGAVVRAGARTARTDADGWFAFEQIAHEPQRLTVSLNGAFLSHDPVRVEPDREPVTIRVQRVPDTLVRMRARVVDGAGNPVEVERARVFQLIDGEETNQEVVEVRIGGVDGMLSREGRWRLEVRGLFGSEAIVDFDVNASMDDVTPTVVVTPGVTIPCEVVFDVPAERVPERVRVYIGGGGQDLRFAGDGHDVGDHSIDLDVTRGTRFSLVDVDPTRPVVLGVDDATFAATWRIDPRAVAGTVRLPLRVAAVLQLRSELPWPQDELHFQIRRSDETEWRDTMRFTNLEGRTELLEWTLEAATFDWRVVWPEDVQPASGRFTAAPTETATVRLTPPRR